MEDHIKIRQEHVRLVRAGEHDGAQKLLEIMWGREEVVSELKKDNLPKLEKKIVEEKLPELTYRDLNSLVKIKGIGKKTIKDIETMFGDLENLKNALVVDRVALRDDIVEKLKEELIE